jgi:hypothetical protein
MQVFKQTAVDELKSTMQLMRVDSKAAIKVL